jgi:hypothetical protein
VVPQSSRRLSYEKPVLHISGSTQSAAPLSVASRRSEKARAVFASTSPIRMGNCRAAARNGGIMLSPLMVAGAGYRVG